MRKCYVTVIQQSTLVWEYIKQLAKPQRVITCSKLTIETLEQCVKYVQN